MQRLIKLGFALYNYPCIEFAGLEIMRLMSATITVLGTMGWIPSERREGPCIAMVAGETLLLFDCGTGARRLAHQELEPMFDRVKRCWLFLSHYHLDHTIGIIYLPKLLEGKKLTIAGPGEDVCGIGAAAALERITTFPLFALPLSEFPMDVDVVDLHEGHNGFPGFSITAVKQQHTAPSLGMRLDDAFAYVTDTVCSERTVKLARGVPLLAHECWLDEEDYQAALKEDDPRVLREHSHISGVAGIAARAEAGTLGLIHLNPAYREGRLRRMEQFGRTIFENTMVLQDFQQFTLE